MKNVVIKASQIRVEIMTWIVCFFISFLSNVGAIIYYKSPWLELLSSLHYVLVFTFFLYLLWSLIRALKKLIFKLIAKR